MFVHDRMSKVVQALDKNTTAEKALDTLRQKELEGLPVTENGDLVGIITRHDILVALSREPSSDFLQENLVSDIMSSSVLTIEPDEPIEEAAYLMAKENFSLLPVVREGRLVGVISEHDIYDTFIEMLGLEEPGSRITMLVPDRIGVIAEITELIKKHDVSIASLATFEAEHGQMGNVVVRLKTIEPREIVEDLREAGFRIQHVSQVWY